MYRLLHIILCCVEWSVFMGSIFMILQTSQMLLKASVEVASYYLSSLDLFYAGFV